MAEPLDTRPRIAVPIDAAGLEALLATARKLLAGRILKGALDENWALFQAQVRALVAEVATARFDAELPAQVRPGEHEERRG
jgi:hypothetical protein